MRLDKILVFACYSLVQVNKQVIEQRISFHHLCSVSRWSCVSFRSSVLLGHCAQREEGQNGLLQGAEGWKLNQPDVPSNSRKKPGNCIER